MFGLFKKKKRPQEEQSLSVVEIDEPKDNFESFPFDCAAEMPGMGRYVIKYQDQRGLKTEREVRVKKLYKYNDEYAIDVHCYMRDGHRTFINDRIISAVNIDTGEIVDDVAKDSVELYWASDEGRTERVLQQEADPVDILAFVGRADGQFRKPEKDIVTEYLKEKHPDLDVDSNIIHIQIKYVGDISNNEFKRAVKRIAQTDQESLKFIFEYAKRIVGTQKNVDPMEQAALDIISKAL